MSLPWTFSVEILASKEGYFNEMKWMRCFVIFAKKRTDGRLVLGSVPGATRRNPDAAQTVPGWYHGSEWEKIDFNNKDSHPYNLIRKPFLSKTLYVGVLIIDQVIRNSTSKFWRVNGYHLLVLSFLRECFEAPFYYQSTNFGSFAIRQSLRPYWSVRARSASELGLFSIFKCCSLRRCACFRFLSLVRARELIGAYSHGSR